MPNALQITDPDSDNPLAQAPSWADAAQSVAGTVSGGVDALGQWLAAQRAKQQRPPMWSMTNPVGTETTRQPQQLTMPTPGVQDVAFWGGQPVSQQFKDTAQSAIGNALGWVGSAGPGGPIRAFHGSPYDFERFDTSKIGTGEGAQAFGRGLYFAGNENVAQTYKFAGQPSYMNPATAAIAQDAYQQAVNSSADNPLKAALTSLWQKRQATSDPIDRRRIDDAFNNFEELTRPGGVGKMYEVGINADPEQFLHWDKPLSEQSPQVQEKLKGLGVTDQGMSGRDIHEALAEKLHTGPKPSGTGWTMVEPTKYTDPAAAAQALRDVGIPGIRYLDQGSRGAGDGTHNYVVFDANTIDILRKYGLAGLGVGLSGAAATNGTPQPPMAQ